MALTLYSLATLPACNDKWYDNHTNSAVVCVQVKANIVNIRLQFMVHVNSWSFTAY